VNALQLAPGSRGLDAGCGIGLQTLLLAAQVGPEGHITGLDLSSELLEEAEAVVQEGGLSQRVSFRQGDVNRLPFADDSFDWAWSVDCVGYAPFDPLPAIRELVRVVKPGGTVALLAWSSERLLPGYPLLEARLNATTAGVAPFTPDGRPELHFLRALSWLRTVGLTDPRGRTLSGDAHAPLSPALRDALTALFQMRWSGAEAELSPDDQVTYRRLCRPPSPDFILNSPDYYAFFTYSLFSGRVAG
jgi:demethylmenaquinone methyltransferase/2-methoxy-6-polyprenyl-1,4-benzoquinol methylase